MREVVSLSFCALIAACGPSGSTGPRLVNPSPITPARPDAAAGGSGGAAAAEAPDAAPVDPAPAPPNPDLAAPVADAAPADRGPAPPARDAAGPAADAAPVGDAAAVPLDVARPVDLPAPVEAAAPDRPADRPPDVSAPDAAPAACLPKPAADEIVSTFEDGSLKATAAAGRDATSWYLINTGADASATLTVVEQPLRCASQRFLRFAGMATATQIPIARVLLRSSDSGVPFYDARGQGYQGVRLSMRAGAKARVALKVSDRNTASVGGVCTVCSDHFSAEVDVPPIWTNYTFPFASLKQAGVGDAQPALDAGALFGIEIVVRAPAAFDLSVDDVSFYR